MNVVVKTREELNQSRAGVGLIGSLLNDSQISFEAVEEEESSFKMDTTTRRRMQMHNISQVMGGMSIMNLSGAAGPVVVETSLIMHEMAVKEEINPLEEPDVKLAFTGTKNLIIGIIVLSLFVINGSMVGPLTVFLPAKSPLIKAMWRTQSNFSNGIFLMIGLYIWKWKEMSFKRDHSPKMLTNSAITAFLGFLWYVGLVVGCSMTITSHAMVMYSSSGVYMLAWALITGAKIHRFEFYGYGLFFLGVFLMLTDPYAVKSGGTGNQYVGDLITFLGAGFGAISGYYNSKNSKIIHPVVIMNHCFVFSTLFQITLASFILGPSRVLSFDKEYGAFGWIADSETFWFLFSVVAPFNGMVCNVCFYVSYYFWPMEIIAGAILTEPFISQVVGVMMGQDKVPGFRTIFGLTIITFGTLISSYGSRVKAVETVQKICEEENLTSKIGLSMINRTRRQSSGP
jgi:hypothetical protein